MKKIVALALLVVSLATSPVLAGVCESTSPAECGPAAATADQGTPGHGRGKHAAIHHCCAAHAQYGACIATYSHVQSASPAAGRPPLLADALLAAAEPNPLLEPPARA